MFRFHLFSFPVTVFPSFLLAAFLLGMNLRDQPWKLVAWVVIVFVSVLIHELGHAVVGRALGGAPEIALEGFGGLTRPNLRRRPGALKEIALSIAGPVFGLLLGGLAYALETALPPERGSPAAWCVGVVEYTSIWWAIFNLVPVLPLDGGQILLTILEGVRRKPSIRVASWISAVVAGALALYSWQVRGSAFVAIWWLLFLGSNLSRAWSAGPEARPPPAPPKPAADATERADVEDATERAREALRVRDLAGALAHAERLENANGPYRQAAGLRLRAGIELARGDNQAAAMYAGQSFSLLQTPDAAVVAARANLRAGEEERARNWIRRAVEAGAAPASVRSDPELGSIA